MRDLEIINTIREAVAKEQLELVADTKKPMNIVEMIVNEAIDVADGRMQIPFRNLQNSLSEQTEDILEAVRVELEARGYTVLD